jgi:hypothetical protein
MKSCRVCNINKPLVDFHKTKSNKDGYNNMCKICRKESNKKYQEENKDSIVITQKKWVSNNIEKVRGIKNKYYQNNKEKQKDYYRQNKEVIQERRREYASAYKKANRAHFNFKEATRRFTKKQATPNWANLKNIKVVYEKAKWLEGLTGLKYDVDHVIPLQSKDVCGLHVWENLQILEAGLNRSKSNKFNGGSLWQS